MQRMLNNWIAFCLAGLLIPQVFGISITRCAHSGHVSLVEIPADMECGMASDSDCMQQFTFKVSVFSSGDIGFEPQTLPFTNLLLWPTQPSFPVGSGHFVSSVRSESPPGRTPHTLFPFRN